MNTSSKLNKIAFTLSASQKQIPLEKLESLEETILLHNSSSNLIDKIKDILSHDDILNLVKNPPDNLGMDPIIFEILALKYPFSTKELLDLTRNTTDSSILSAIAARSDLTHNLISILKNELMERNILSALVQNKNLPQSSIIDILFFLLRNKNKPGIALYLKIFSKRKDLPIKVLEELSFLEDNFINTELAQKEKLYKLPGLYIELSKNPEPEIRQKIAKRKDLRQFPEVFKRLKIDPNEKVRMLIAGREDLSSEEIKQFSNDPNEKVRREIAFKKDLPLDLIYKLSNDKEPIVLAELAARKDLPDNIILKLNSSTNEFVIESLINSHLDFYLNHLDLLKEKIITEKLKKNLQELLINKLAHNPQLYHNVLEKLEISNQDLIDLAHRKVLPNPIIHWLDKLKIKPDQVLDINQIPIELKRYFQGKKKYTVSEIFEILKESYYLTKEFHGINVKKPFNYVSYNEDRSSKEQTFYGESYLKDKEKHGRIYIMVPEIPKGITTFFDQWHLHLLNHFSGWVAWIENNINGIEEPVFQIWEIQSDLFQATQRLKEDYYKIDSSKPLFDLNGKIIESNFSKRDKYNSELSNNLNEVQELFDTLKKYGFTRSKIENLSNDWPKIFFNEALKQAKKMGYRYVALEKLKHEREDLQKIMRFIQYYPSKEIEAKTFNHQSENKVYLFDLNNKQIKIAQKLKGIANLILRK